MNKKGSISEEGFSKILRWILGLLLLAIIMIIFYPNIIKLYETGYNSISGKNTKNMICGVGSDDICLKKRVGTAVISGEQKYNCTLKDKNVKVYCTIDCVCKAEEIEEG